MCALESPSSNVKLTGASRTRMLSKSWPFWDFLTFSQSGRRHGRGLEPPRKCICKSCYHWHFGFGFNGADNGLDVTHPGFLPILHRISTTNDCNRTKTSPASVHHIHRCCLGTCDCGTRSRQDVAADARPSVPFGHPRSWVFFHSSFPRQYMVH